MLDLTKIKAFAYERFNVTHLFEYALIGHKTLWKTSKMFISLFPKGHLTLSQTSPGFAVQVV